MNFSIGIKIFDIVKNAIIFVIINKFSDSDNLYTFKLLMNLKIAITLFIAVVTSININAHDFESNGIYYNIIDNDSEIKTVEVTFKGDRHDEYKGYEGEIIIPETVEYSGITYSVIAIGNRAFEYCGITSVSMPNTIKYIGDSAFEYCPSLTSLNIPDSLISLGVESLFGCFALTSITLPESFIYIGEGALSAMPNLVDIFVKGNNPMFCSIDGVLFNKDKTELWVYPAGRSGEYKIPESVTNIIEWAFCGCGMLTTVQIPDGVTYIGDYAFIDCFNLATAELPQHITYLGSKSFANTALTSVKIPDSITSINSFAFSDCKSLEYVNIPESVILIDDFAFHGCDVLKQVTLPANLGSLGFKAFFGCYSLNYITSLNTTPPTCGNMAFDEIDKEKCILHVPSESIEKYKAVTPWNQFKTIDSDVSLIKETSSEINRIVSARYSVDGKPVNAGFKGIVIEIYSDGETLIRKQ